MRAIAKLFLFLMLISTQCFALDQFGTEQAAAMHCPADIVVWLNIPTGLFHYKGKRWYGRTKHGAYVCMAEAVKEGARASKNG